MILEYQKNNYKENYSHLNHMYYTYLNNPLWANADFVSSFKERELIHSRPEASLISVFHTRCKSKSWLFMPTLQKWSDEKQSNTKPICRFTNGTLVSPSSVSTGQSSEMLIPQKTKWKNPQISSSNPLWNRHNLINTTFFL